MNCKHCGEAIKESSVLKYWVHHHNMSRCQSPDVEYGHLAEPEGEPCRADGPNPCLGAQR